MRDEPGTDTNGAGEERADGAATDGDRSGTVRKSEEEWRETLSPEEYRVLREAGTERPFTGAYVDSKESGLYRCRACSAPLFRSDTKYDSRSGWPAFWAPVSEEAVEAREDTSHGMRRTEVRCARCGSHLGHVFPDGPDPTGMRYCVNSISLRLDTEAGEGAGEEGSPP